VGGGHLLLVNREQKEARANRDTEKEQAREQAMIQQRAAAPELAQVFHMDRDRAF
jgi:hypothetical protein